MYIFNNHTADITKLEPVTFQSLKLTEFDIEELLRKNIEMLCDEEESMLIIGRQVANEKKGRSDLTAIDKDGNIVLIEIKRDKRDIENRTEPFEFQAIRYAASCATINSLEEVVTKIYAPYIEKYRTELDIDNNLTAYEAGIRKLKEFLDDTGAINFNKRQRIILVASSYDEQTLSAVAWLNKNNVEIICFELTPLKYNNEVIFDMNKLFPLMEYEDYFIDIRSKTKSNQIRIPISRRNLPKIDSMLEWGVVKAGDIICPKNRSEEATLQKNGKVKYEDRELSLQAWLKEIYNWDTVATYTFSVHKETGKTLSEIREEYMNRQEDNAEIDE